MRVTDNSAEVSRQQQHYSDGIGSFTPAGAIAELLAFSQDATLPQFYSDYADDYWYEMLEKEGLMDKVRGIAIAWSEVRARSAVRTGEHAVDVLARRKPM